MFYAGKYEKYTIIVKKCETLISMPLFLNDIVKTECLPGVS